MAQSVSRNLEMLLLLKKYTKNSSYVKIRNYGNLTLSNRYITSTPKILKLVCWKCGQERTELLFCDKCHIIQKPSEKGNYFSLFGFKEKFNLDQMQLTKQFRQLQSLVHPDKYSNKSNEEKNISQECSSLLNTAYSHLQTPLKRAEYLLKLNGETISESDTIDEPTFLMEMMRLNEEVEDANNNPDQLKTLHEMNKKELARLTKLIDDSFEKNDLESVKKTIIKMKYFTSLEERINNYLREMGITD